MTTKNWITLDSIRDLEAGVSYPGSLLRGRTDALVMFAAAWLGRQDAVWVAEAGLTATCVDNDGDRLEEMRALYPDDWQFVNADVYEFGATVDRQWDVVSLDCPSGHFDRCAEHVQLWCDLARYAVILGTGFGTKVDVPDGWAVTDLRKRSTYMGGVWWTCLEPV